jgi:hypothetical protein
MKYIKRVNEEWGPVGFGAKISKQRKELLDKILSMKVSDIISDDSKKEISEMSFYDLHKVEKKIGNYKINWLNIIEKYRDLK